MNEPAPRAEGGAASGTLDRRGLLRGSLAVSAAAAAAACKPGNVPAPRALPAEAPPTAEPSQGYRLSEHIRRYYALARF